jgi:hypothetical protein
MAGSLPVDISSLRAKDFARIYAIFAQGSCNSPFIIDLWPTFSFSLVFFIVEL